MSCFDVKILDPDINTITIESCVGDQPASIEVITYDNTNILEISHCLSFADIKVQDILAGSGINIVTSSGIYTVSLSDTYLTSSDIADFLESVQDIIGQSGLSAGSYVNLNYNDSTGLTTISVTGLQPSGNYSVVGHNHLSSDITNFNSSVSGLLPSVTGIGQASSTFINNVYTISVSGLQPSGNYSVVGHTHVTNNITNFASGVSGLLPSVTGSGYATSNFANNTYTISVTGLQPSGNYSVVGHTHTSNQITDFNNAVSGLIPPSNFTSLSGISGVTVSNSGTNYIVSLTDPTIQLADITDLSSNGRTFLLTPSSSNLATLITDETGSGSLVFNNSPALSGTPTVPTASSGTNNTQIANTAFVRTEITNLVNSAPSTLDTLNELASALGNDPNFATTVTNSLANKAALSGAVFTGSVTIPSGTGNFNSLTVNNIAVSLSGHLHSTSDITNFNSGVSGLLPNITGINYITSSFSNNTYSIGVTGLQPSGNYSVVGHSHVSSNITNFNSSVSGLLPTVTGTGQATSSFINNTYTISVTGLQPSGNYSLVGHSHLSSDITDFNSVVSGLLPVKNLTAGSGIGISSLSGDFTISVTGTFGLTSEQVDDRVSSLLVAGSYTNLNYDDNANTLTISVTGLQPSGNYANAIHNHTSSDITNFNSSVSGLLPSVTGSGYVTSNFSNNIYTIGVTGLQPSGNYSIVGHTHLSNDITNFNSSVSGLIPVKNIVPGTSVNISSISGEYTISVTGVAASSASSLITSCHNLTGSTISKMSVVYINGGHGNEPTITLAIANGEATSSKTFGVTMEDIPFNQSGDVVVVGALIDVNTNQFSVVEGTTLYLSPSVSGALTTTKPLAPNHLVTVGKIVRNHTNQGIIQVSIQNGFELGELHNVSTNGSGDNGKFLQYNSGSGLWISSSSGNFTTLTVNNTGVSLVGHTHNSSNIIDFNSAVSGLLPSVTGSGYATSNFANNIYTISVTGLQPSGNYSTVGHTHTSSDITNFNSSVSGVIAGQVTTDLLAGSGIALTYNSGLDTLTISSTGLQPSGNYSTVGHTHTASNITDFNSSVSGLLPVKNIIAGSNVSVSSISGNFTISATGLQPSGNYSTVGHTHTSSDITNFNSSVSGLLPSVTGSGYATSNFANNIYTISVTGLQPSGNYSTVGHTHTSSDITNFNSSVSGVIAGQVTTDLLAGSGIALTYNSGLDTLTISSTGLQPSGNYSTVGHTHTSSNITDFNSSVSGLLPTISNSGDNRLLTSTGSSIGINAESNLTFDGSTLNIDGNLTFDTFTESLISIGNSSSGVVLSIGSGTVQTCTLTNSCTFTMPTATAGKSFTMFLNTGSGNFTASFSGVLWSDSSPPTITTASSKVDILSFISDGNYWYGSYSQNYG